MRIILTSLILLLVSTIGKAQLSFNGNHESPVNISPESNTGLEAIYVLYNTSGVTATYVAESASSTVEWLCYSQMGGGYSEPVNFTRDGKDCTITLPGNDIGYIITDNGRQQCFWITNYANHAMELDNISINNEDSDCAMTTLDVDGSAPRINYYTITGIPRELSRDINIAYYTLEWDEPNTRYIQKYVTETIQSMSSTIHVPAPLCDTDFEISGDRFLKTWGREISVLTPNFQTKSIDAHTSATTLSTKNDNEISSDGGELGGSAPVTIAFNAYTTDGVAYREWQMSRFPDFDIIDLRFNQDDVEYTFRESGITYVRFIAANASGDCEWISETYQVSIGESKLECPNAFSPGASEGVNDEWKVSYKSIVSYECHIFNQWGIELFSTHDPAQGWDGKRNGKVVPSGVYYYVIKAKGSDGKDYSLSGDINIINSKQRLNGSNTDL